MAQLTAASSTKLCDNELYIVHVKRDREAILLYIDST